jgi:hypothetical protein
MTVSFNNHPYDTTADRPFICPFLSRHSFEKHGAFVCHDDLPDDNNHVTIMSSLI